MSHYIVIFDTIEMKVSVFFIARLVHLVKHSKTFNSGNKLHSI
jgi:hypothetical protein